MTGVGYRNNSAVGTAEGDEPEGMYMVANGRYYNDLCCFDYGNGERNSENNGNGTMDAIYFGNCTSWGRGDGGGLNAANKSVDSDYVTAMLKGGPNLWAVKVGDSAEGGLTTMYEGVRPSNGYDPMKKEGAIILGTGGDNSFAGVGDFFEGAMTTGYPTDEIDDAVQENIVAAGYGV
jgi:hypothetical protein